MMIGKPVALIQVPNQRGYTIGEAARYLGICHQKLRQLTDAGRVRCRRDGRNRIFLLEDLNAFLDSLPTWVDNGDGERPGLKSAEKEISHGNL